ncbi:hypothetical protein [Microvirga sp. VF16]|uniref:hypothetical protein n=1 Tax=Microvirga sp. VF16 TaxID=2807101 RepID=UPI0035300808
MKHDFSFTPAFSLFVECATEDQISHLSSGLAEGEQSSCQWETMDSVGNSYGSTIDTASPGNSICYSFSFTSLMIETLGP